MNRFRRNGVTWTIKSYSNNNSRKRYIAYRTNSKFNVNATISLSTMPSITWWARISYDGGTSAYFLFDIGVDMFYCEIMDILQPFIIIEENLELLNRIKATTRIFVYPVEQIVQQFYYEGEWM